MTSALRRIVRSPRANDAVQRIVEVAVAVVYVGIYLTFSTLEMPPGQPQYTGPPWVAWLLAVAIGVPIAVRHWWPEQAWVVSALALTTTTLLHLTLEPWIPVAFMLYTVALRAPRRRAVGALGVTFVLSGAALVISGGEGGGLPAAVGVTTYVWLVNGIAWVAGVIVRERREAAAESRRRDAEQALADERLQIARELHDVVAHSMSLIAVQAGVANHVVSHRPEAARDALRVIETTSRDALTDIRRLLGILRTPDAPFAFEAQPAPTPGLSALPALVEQAVAGGVLVTSDVRVDARRHSDAVQLVVYRVVQEGLTNVRKHAGPTTCRVVVTERDEELCVVVENDRATEPVEPSAGGHGLVGLRERVELFGGTLEAGPHGSGFRLVARLPVTS